MHLKMDCNRLDQVHHALKNKQETLVITVCFMCTSIHILYL